MSCSPWGGKELDMTERLSTAQHIPSGPLVGTVLESVPGWKQPNLPNFRLGGGLTGASWFWAGVCWLATCLLQVRGDPFYFKTHLHWRWSVGVSLNFLFSSSPTARNSRQRKKPRHGC